MVLARRTRGLFGEVRKQPFARVVPSPADRTSDVRSAVDLDPVLREISADNARRSGGIRERHIRVRSEQVKSIARQSGSRVLRAPAKHV